ncbi:uncharacterized protein BJ212DRAFT_1298023 [Suillus subaureus]|uniref:Uncharacterized protein n=1 Tax=Suillus subaureus TaxID=48587 RepID=A0A9P7EEF3_9AGAM|nr:uncharacterized protein BJ212DRAFT_1298023 [Suillus subaureus]KAG1819543.1 hypothetical protein BJ212DRAFT_1298023 [Suillus subaureus]
MPETHTCDHVQEGHLPRPIHWLQYLDLAFFNNDMSLLMLSLESPEYFKIESYLRFILPHLQLKTSESTLSAVTHAMTSITPPNNTQTSALLAPTSLVPISPRETVTTSASTTPLASGAVSFEMVKAGLAIHHLLRGVLREIHSCINQDAGFKVPQWQYVLEENLMFEPLMSTMLKLMHAILAGITIYISLDPCNYY